MAVVYGIHSVREALQAPGNRVERICIQRGYRNPRIHEIVEIGREFRIPLSFEDRAWLDRKAAGKLHQGILCYVSETSRVGPLDIIKSASSPGLVVLLDGIEDPQNLGAILRSAAAAGVDGVLLPGRRSAGLGPAAVRASAGAAAHVRIAKGSSAVRLMEVLKTNGYWLLGMDAESDKPLWEVDLSVPIALVLGNERSGLHRLVRERCDFLASIPMRGRVRSYNVSVSAGIAFYEVLRQRSL